MLNNRLEFGLLTAKMVHRLVMKLCCGGGKRMNDPNGRKESGNNGQLVECALRTIIIREKKLMAFRHTNRESLVSSLVQ